MTPVRGGKTSNQRRSDGGGHSGPPFRGRKRRNNRGGRTKAATAKAGAGANNGATSGTSHAEAAIPVGSNPEVNKEGTDQAEDHLQDLDDTAVADVNGNAVEADDAEVIADDMNGSAIEPFGGEAPDTAPTATDDADVPQVGESSSNNPAASAPDIDPSAATEPYYDPAGPSGPEEEVPSQQLDASASKEGEEDAEEENEDEEIEGDDVEEEEGDEAEEDEVIEGEEADEDGTGDVEGEGGLGAEDEMEQDDSAVETNDNSSGENQTLVEKSASMPASSEKNDTKIETSTPEAALSSETTPVNEADVETSKLKDSGDTPASTAANLPAFSSVNSTTPVPAGSAPASAAAKNAGDITADTGTKKTGPEKTKAAGGNPLSVSGGNRWSPHVSSPQGDVSVKGLVLNGNNEDVKRTADFFLAFKGNSYKAARVFIETVLANIDRRERLENESLKRSHATTGKDKEKDNGDSNKRMRTESNVSTNVDAGNGSGRGRRGGARQRERDDRKRDRADSRDSREQKRDSKGGERGSGRGKDSFAGGGNGPPFRDLEHWDPDKALKRNILINDQIDEHNITVILLIPNEKRVVGIVVGKRGLRLKTILSTSKCSITVENDSYCDKESGVRKVVLRGTIRSVVLAQQLIMDLVWEEMETAIGVMQFMIPDEASSRIIGRQGSFIKQLQRESACKINTLKDVELRSGLKARVLSVCGNNYAMSKGLYLVARKIASRWEYAPEWEGGDPTVEKGDGLPPGRSATGSASQGQSSSGGGYGGNPNHAKYDNMDIDSPPAQRRQRGGQRSRGGRADDLDSYGRYDRDGGGRGGDRDGGGRGDRDGGGRGGERRGSGGDRSGGGGNNDRSGGSRENRFGRGREPAPMSSVPGPHSGGPPGPTAANPWVDPALLASVVGGTAAVGGAPPVGSAEAWQRLLGQIPTSARESLGIPAPQLGTQAPIATDMYAQVVGGQHQQQQQQAMQQPQQVSWQPQLLQQVAPATVSGAPVFLTPGTIPPAQSQQQFQQPQQTQQQQDSSPQIVYQSIPGAIQTAPSQQQPQQQQQQQQPQQPQGSQQQGMFAPSSTMSMAPPQGLAQGPPTFPQQPQQQPQQVQTMYSTGQNSGQVVAMTPPSNQQVMLQPGQQQQQVYPSSGQSGQPSPQNQPQNQMQQQAQQQPQQGIQASPQQQPKQHQQPQNSSSHQQSGGVASSGPPQQQQQVGQKVNSSNPMMSHQGQMAPPQQQFLQQPPQGQQMDYSHTSSQQQQQDQRGAPTPAPANSAVTHPSMEVRIPEASVGYVFGKGGSTIAEVKAKAGVTIRTENNADGSSSRLLHVSGEMASIQKAITLLNDLVVKWQSLPPKRQHKAGGGGGGGYRGGGRGGNDRNSGGGAHY